MNSSPSALNTCSNTCPSCSATLRQTKAGTTRCGSQRLRCGLCRRHYTPLPKAYGYAPALKHQALCLYADGLSFRRIARALSVSHQSVANWVNAAADALPPPARPSACQTVELDELHTFVAQKKRCLLMHGGRPRHTLHRRLER